MSVTVVCTREMIIGDHITLKSGDVCDCECGNGISGLLDLKYFWIRISKILPISRKTILKFYISYIPDDIYTHTFSLNDLIDKKHMFNNLDNKGEFPECSEFFNDFMTINEYRNQKIDDILNIN